MDARGHGRGPRSRYRPDRFGPGSIATAATSAAAAAVFLGADRAAADIVVSVFPLRWPDASWVHVASVLALAAPAVLPRRLR
jgi:energy-coupling factor transport system permease protein